MKRTTKRKINNFIAYLNRTYKYKIAIIAVVVLGYVGMKMSGDGGALILALLMSPLFFIDVKNEEEES